MPPPSRTVPISAWLIPGEVVRLAIGEIPDRGHAMPITPLKMKTALRLNPANSQESAGVRKARPTNCAEGLMATARAALALEKLGGDDAIVGRIAVRLHEADQ